MKGLVNRRHRVLRVRAVQHSMAVAETARARDEANGIAHNLERLRAVRDELFDTQGMANGASFAAMQELATRLEQASRQLDGALSTGKRLGSVARIRNGKNVIAAVCPRRQSVVAPGADAQPAAPLRERLRQPAGDA